MKGNFRRYTSLILCLLLIFTITFSKPVEAEAFVPALIPVGVPLAKMLILLVGGLVLYDMITIDRMAEAFDDADDTYILSGGGSLNEYIDDNVDDWMENGEIVLSMSIQQSVNDLISEHFVEQHFVKSILNDSLRIYSPYGLEIFCYDLDLPIRYVDMGIDRPPNYVVDNAFFVNEFNKLPHYYFDDYNQHLKWDDNVSLNVVRNGTYDELYNYSTKVRDIYTMFPSWSYIAQYWTIIIARDASTGQPWYFYATKAQGYNTCIRLTPVNVFLYEDILDGQYDYGPTIAYNPPISEPEKDLRIPFPTDLNWDDVLGKDLDGYIQGLGGDVPSNPDIPDNPDIPEVGTGEYSGILSSIYTGITSVVDSISAVLSALVEFFSIKDFDLDFSGLQIGLTQKFPFCIPFDFRNIVSVFSSQPADFEFNINLETQYFQIDHNVDLSKFMVPILFFRYIVVFWFVFILISRTRDFMKW